MAWTDACKFEAVEQIKKRAEKTGKIVPAIKAIAEESGIPVPTLKRWFYPDSDYKPKCTSSGTLCTPKEKEINIIHTIQFDSDQRKILLGLYEKDGRRFLAIQEYRVGVKSKEIPTKNHLYIPVDVFSQFREAMDAMGAIIQEECSGEIGFVDLGPQENDEGGLSAENNGEISRDPEGGDADNCEKEIN